MTLTSYSVIVTDLDDTPHTITDDISSLQIALALSSAVDTFKFTILNIDDQYSYIKQGCEISISTGYGGSNTTMLVGHVDSAIRTLDKRQMYPLLQVSGTDWTNYLKNVYFAKRYTDLEVSAVVKAILDSIDYTSGKTYREIAGIDSDYSNIIATAYSVNTATFNWKSLADAFKELADRVGNEWYVDTSKKLHWFNPADITASHTITDDDLDGTPQISSAGTIINRAVVIGGYQQVTDQSGNTHTTTTTVTDSTAKNQSFTPAANYLSSVLVWTELVASSISDLIISIQADDAGAPNGKNLPNSYTTVKIPDIHDGGYTEIRFSQHVTLTAGDTYWIVINGTTSNGVKVGVDAGGVLDYVTREPVRVASMVQDTDSITKYGLYNSPPFRDQTLEDPDLAYTMAAAMLSPEPKSHARIRVHGNDIIAGDVVRLTLSETGIGIDKDMIVRTSNQTLGNRFIYNDLELEEW